MLVSICKYSVHMVDLRLDNGWPGKSVCLFYIDLMHDVVEQKDMELLFTQGTHHRRVSVIFITQNLFPRGKHARTIALNTWYLVLMKNLRDSSTVNTLSRQLYPGKSKGFMEAYQDALTQGYMVVDMSPHAEDAYRLRTRVFPKEDTIVYKLT